MKIQKLKPANLRFKKNTPTIYLYSCEKYSAKPIQFAADILNMHQICNGQPGEAGTENEFINFNCSAGATKILDSKN